MIVRICILNNSRLNSSYIMSQTTIMYDVEGEIASEVYWIQENSKGFGLFVSR
jgi:hypothetical protein